MEQTPNTRPHLDTHLVWGLILILFGAMLMMGRLTADEGYRYWPMLLILLGSAKLIDPPQSGLHQGSRRPGAWLLFIGLWGLVSEFHLFGLDYSNSWPLMIVGVGLMLVWRSFDPPAPSRTPASASIEPALSERSESNGRQDGE